MITNDTDKVEGAPMGSPPSPAIANLFMEIVKTKALTTSSLKPKLWLRYVDDILVIWPHGHQKLLTFFNHLNEIHTQIKFTMEAEEENKLAFLDVMIMKKPYGTLGHTVYRKKIHTNRYLNAYSHHHPKQIHLEAKTLITRSRRLADNDHIKEELDNIETTLGMNGYSKRTIKAASRVKKKQRED
ncbi:hypothetical protein JTB14_031703 [Gonioctena quinquepunctata]|nr:hypothetical protein JTB14_031703 [Gonioctena quinquepunctata]